MKIINRTQLLAIVLTITLFGVFLVLQMLQQRTLYSIDPWTQHFFTDYSESQQLFDTSTKIYSGEFVLPYASMLRTTARIVSQGGLIDSFLIYEVGSVALRIVYILLIMMIVIAMTHKVQYALVTGLLVFSSPFFVFRSHLLIPENVAVLFFLTMIWGFEKYRKTGRILFLLVVLLSLVGNALYQPPSMVISIIIIVSYIVLFIVNGHLRKVEFTFMTLLFSIILLIPIFDTLIQVVTATWASFGDNSLWAQYVGTNNLGLAPTVNTFFNLIGYPVIIFAVLGMVAIVRRWLRPYSHLLVMLGLMLTLMINTSPNIYLSPNRLQDYLYIPLLLISAVYISVLFHRTDRLVRMAVVSILITFGIATMIQTPPWLRIEAGAKDIVQTVNSGLASNPNAIVFIDSDAMITSVLIRHPEQLCAYWDPIFQWYSPPMDSDVPDCTEADYRISRSNRALQGYQIVKQVDTYVLYEHLPET